MNVMRKEPGFGEAYGPNRKGEWEYVAYLRDGTHQTTPQNSFAPAICHRQAGPGRTEYFATPSASITAATVQFPITFSRTTSTFPGTLRTKAGSFVTFYNNDVTDHTITDDQLVVATPAVCARAPGEFNFHWADVRCRRHLPLN